MEKVYQWRVWCTTEGAFTFREKAVIDGDESPPTTCINDTTHTIDASSWTIVDELTKEQVVIQEEEIPTQGYYKLECRELSVPAVVGEFVEDWSWDININFFNMGMYFPPDAIGDVWDLEGAPETVIGGLTLASNIGDTTFNVSSTVTDNIKKGFVASITDGVNTNKLGHVIDVDSVNGTITVKDAATDTFSPGAFVRMTIPRFENYVIAYEHTRDIGAAKIGGSFLPANTVVRHRYQNNNGLAKKIVLFIEYLY